MPSGRDILVSVSPRLLGDVLTAALRQHGLAVQAWPALEEAGPPRAPCRFAVAVVTGAVPPEAEVDEVITINAEGVLPGSVDGARDAAGRGTAGAAGARPDPLPRLLAVVEAALRRLPSG